MRVFIRSRTNVRRFVLLNYVADLLKKRRMQVFAPIDDEVWKQRSFLEFAKNSNFLPASPINIF